MARIAHQVPSAGVKDLAGTLSGAFLTETNTTVELDRAFKPTRVLARRIRVDAWRLPRHAAEARARSRKPLS